jgi:hypothetical protein
MPDRQDDRDARREDRQVGAIATSVTQAAPGAAPASTSRQTVHGGLWIMGPSDPPPGARRARIRAEFRSPSSSLHEM